MYHNLKYVTICFEKNVDLLNKEGFFKMGLFSFNYAKTGPGVDPNAPKKRGIFLFFELLGRKFFKLFQAMWISTAFSLPYIVLMFLFITGIYGGYFERAINSLAPGGALPSEDVRLLMIMLCGFATVAVYLLWGSGPASAGFAYVTRCFTREEHAWIWSDFYDKFKENFKQSLILVVMDFAFLYLIPNAAILNWDFYTTTNQFIWIIPMYVCIIAFVVYTFMHFHIYQIMVTYDCKFFDLIKNSLLLALGKSPVNLIITCIVVGILITMFNLLHPIMSIFISLAVLFGLLRYPFEFYSARTIEKIIQNSGEDK